jgi:hypothetical protein
VVLMCKNGGVDRVADLFAPLSEGAAPCSGPVLRGTSYLVLICTVGDHPPQLSVH